MRHYPHKPLSHRLFHGSLWALFTMFVWEIVEEGIETLIAFCISEVVAMFFVKALSALAIIGATQGIKVCIKRFLVPVIKTLTYKEGFDKMSKIKQFFTWIFANKKSLTSTVVNALGAGAGVAASWTIDSLPVILVKGYNIAPIVYTAICVIAFVLKQLGVCGKGFEEIDEYFSRIELIKAEKEQKAIEKEASKELAMAEKLANQTQAQQEKAKAKAEALAQAQAEKQKAEAEHRAKVEQAKAKLLSEQNKK